MALRLIVAFVCAAGVALAQEAPRDPRLRVLPYEEDRVISLDGHLGYQMMIEFDLQERIENVSIGDSLGWQVTPNRAATLLFVKPVVAHAVTNMTVVTTRRRYAFALRAREAAGPDDARIIYGLRFTYADEQAAPDTPGPSSFNFDYASSGSPTLVPLRVFDDGHFTYFQMREGAEVPAIFALSSRGEEELINSQMRDGVTIVDRVADAFVLRHGRDAAIVRSGAAPQPETSGRRLSLRRGRRS
ncbi:MAG: TrbG/VirB9 family P-type conjugative transfer protein [Caulobacteraceae bacterium]